MGRIITSVLITNNGKEIRCDCLVDTGASSLILPSAWKDRLGDFSSTSKVRLETADQRIIEGEACGPVKIQIEGFRAIYNECIFMDMEPKDGGYEPILGYIILEQSQATVDMIGHRLIKVSYLDLK
ncbi:MAG: retropepsin-like aspartic protease [bacterium]